MNTNFPHPLALNYQSEPDKVMQSITFLEQKAREAKTSIEELIYMLDLQEKVPWPDMLERFASLASAMSNIENALKKSGLQSASVEDNGALLRTHVLVPQRLQQEIDNTLAEVTSYRVTSWNHDVVPDYLRTKMNPELEQEETLIDMERNNKGTEIIARQISTLNKHADSLMQTLPIAEKSSEAMDKPTFNREDTTRLVRAIMQGEGLRQQRVQTAPTQAQPMMASSVPPQMPPRPPTAMPHYRSDIPDDHDPPSLLLDGYSDLRPCLEIFSLKNKPSTGKVLKYYILLPFMIVPIRVLLPDGYPITLEFLKEQIFTRLKRFELPGHSWEPSNYVFKCFNKETTAMESFYHEDLDLTKVPSSTTSYPILFLYPRKGALAERELEKQISDVLGHSLELLENNFSEEHKECRANFWQVVKESAHKNQTELKHFAFPEETYWPPTTENFLTPTFSNKLKSGKLHYEVFYCSRNNEEAGNDKQFYFSEVEFDKDLTPDTLVERALGEMRNNGHTVEDDQYILQLVGRKSYITGNKRLVLNYRKIRSELENYQNPKFVIRRLDLVLSQYTSPRPLIKPHYVMVEEARLQLENTSKESVQSIWNVDEMLLIRPCSYSMFEPQRDPNATVVCVFTFFVGKAVIGQYASEDVSPMNPRWAKNMIYTDFYVKDIPESLSLCVQLFEVVRKERPKSKNKKEDETAKRHDGQMMYRGWPEFIDLIKENRPDEKKDDKLAVTCVGWYHVPMFNWQRRLTFGIYTYSLWAGEPELGKSNMCETKGDKKSNYRLTIEVSTASNRGPQEVQAVEDHRWAELCPNVVTMVDIFKRDLEATNKVLFDIHDLYKQRINQGYLDLSEEVEKHIWDLRYIWAGSYSDALLLLIEGRRMWTTRDYFGEIYQMILKGLFKKLSLQTCIAILASSNGDRIIRQFATECTDRNLEDRKFPLYILPLVQALKTEPRVYSALSCMLLRRSMRNWKVGHKVFWLLRSELMLLRGTVGTNNKLFKKITILLEAYLRGNEDRLPSLAKQVTMVELMNKMTAIVKTAGTRELATKKLREELREKCALLENIDSPLDTTAVLGELIIDKCKILSSAKAPLRIAWKNPLPFADHFLTTHEIIFKNGDDLRQDMLVLQMLEVMEECWVNMGMDCSLSIYPVLPTGKMLGMIGVVPNSSTIFQIQSEGGKMGTAVKSLETTFLNKFVRSNATTGKEYLESVERFMMSCVGYSVATYVMGIKDRHNDNIMVSKDGKLFHIDFGHILGHGKKKLGIQRDRVPFILVEHFLCVIGKGQPVTKDNKDIHQFRKLCELAYKRLFGYRHLFVAIFTAMKQMELPELSTERDLDHVRKTLQVTKDSEEDAGAFFDEKFEVALNGSWSTKTNWFFHTVKHL